MQTRSGRLALKVRPSLLKASPRVTTLNFPAKHIKLPTPDMFVDSFEAKVGEDPNSTTFILHKGVVALYSKFFAAALKEGTFKEGRDNYITLADEDPKTFQDFICWAYTKSLDLGYEEGFERAIKLWIFADRYDVPLLANDIINGFHGHVLSTKNFDLGGLPFVYENTTVPSALRRYFLTIVSITCGPEDPQILLMKPFLSNEAMWDIFTATDNVTWQGDRESQQEKILSLDICDFHMHENDEKC